MRATFILFSALTILLLVAAGCTGFSAGTRPAGATPATPAAMFPLNPLPFANPVMTPGQEGTVPGLIARAGDTVSVTYTGTYENGTLFDSNRDTKPIEFTLGNASVIDGLNEAIVGMAQGEERTVQIPAAKAYGEYNESLVWTVNRTGPLANTSFIAGKYYSIHNRENNAYSFVRALEVTPATVTLDGNNPLAGMNFTFTIRLVKITRP